MARVTRLELLGAITTNAVLTQAQEEKLNFPGSGGIKQFIKDFVERNFKVIGIEHLGMAQRYVQARKEKPDFEAEVRNNLGASMGQKNVDAIIDAHSQHPASLIANTLFAACPSNKLIISQCQDAEVNLLKEGSDIYQVISVPYIPVRLIESNKEILIPGPVTAKFKLMPPKGQHNKTYYQFDSLETDNEHLIQMARGKIIIDQELLNYYDNPEVQKLTQAFIQQYQQLEQLKEQNVAIHAKYSIESQARSTDRSEALEKIKELQDNIRKLLERQMDWVKQFSDLTIDIPVANHF